LTRISKCGIQGAKFEVRRSEDDDEHEDEDERKEANQTKR
jgi:hypothetical protein